METIYLLMSALRKAYGTAGHWVPHLVVGKAEKMAALLEVNSADKKAVSLEVMSVVQKVLSSVAQLAVCLADLRAGSWVQHLAVLMAERTADLTAWRLAVGSVVHWDSRWVALSAGQTDERLVEHWVALRVERRAERWAEGTACSKVDR